MRKFLLTALALGVAPALTLTGAAAQEEELAPELNYDDIAGGWSANAFLGNMVVDGVDEDAIGSVENLVFSDEGELVSIIAQVGGFWDIGDTHVNVPWHQVKITADTRLTVPLSEDAIEEVEQDDDLLLLDDARTIRIVDDDVEATGGVWKATDAYGRSIAYDASDEIYSTIDDLIVVDAEVVAFTDHDGHAFSYDHVVTPLAPGDAIELPYLEQEILVLPVFDVNRLGNPPES